jgi:hypothetical protein
MNAVELLNLLAQKGVAVSLGTPSTKLSLDAPRGTLTPELTELLREHKGDLIQFGYEREERIAIEDEGQLSDTGRAFIKANKRLSPLPNELNQPNQAAHGSA